MSFWPTATIIFNLELLGFVFVLWTYGQNKYAEELLFYSSLFIGGQVVGGVVF